MKQSARGRVVDGVWSSEDDAGPFRVLPDGCVDVVGRSGALFLVGPMRRARVVESKGRTVGVRFTPGSVLSWLGTSPAELLDCVVPLRELGIQAETTEQVLQLALRSEPCPRVAHVVSTLRVHPSTRVCDLADDVGWTPRHLRRRVQEETGLSPRTLRRIFRFQAAVQRTRGQPLGTLAFEAGYADQAHMSREFKRLAGVTPSRLASESRDRPPHRTVS